MNKKDDTKEKIQNSEKPHKKNDLTKQEVIDALYDLYITAKEYQKKTNFPSKK